MSNADMYREHILDLFQNPHNFGSLKDADRSFTLNNPLCGDEITVEVKIADNSIIDIRWRGSGCAISMAASSLVSDAVLGRCVADVLSMTKEDVLELLHIPVSPVRLKCALLCLEALQNVIGGKNA